MAKPSSDIPVITPEVATTILIELLRASNEGHRVVPPFLWGAPGVGKSAIVREAAEKEGVEFIDLRLVQIDNVDLRGLPYVVDDPEHAGQKLSGFAPPKTLPSSGRGILFLDEFPQATPLVQNAASELVLDRRIGDYKLPDGWIMVAAGNRRQDRAATQELPSHLKNRFAHLEINPAFSDWKSWATGEGEVEPALVAFLDQNQSKLNAFNPDVVASPTSRTWEFVSHIMKTFKDKKARNAMIGGCVGKGMQAELTAYLADADDMPTLEQICSDPNGAPVPDNTSSCRAVLDNLASQVKPEFAAAAATYAKRHLKDDQLVMVVLMMGRKDSSKFTEDPTFKAWSDELMSAGV